MGNLSSVNNKPILGGFYRMRRLSVFFIFSWSIGFWVFGTSNSNLIYAEGSGQSGNFDKEMGHKRWIYA